jgi:N-acyl-D-amino-acid deacylase
LERLRQPASRGRVRVDVAAQNREWDQTFVAWVPETTDQSIQGQSIAAIAEHRGLDAIDALFDVLIESSGEASMVLFVMDEQDVRYVMRHPLSMFGTDGFGLKPTGVLGEGQPHPRCYGTYPRILGYYVREERALRLEDAVRKSTGLPAQRLGLAAKGRIRVDADADLVIFEPTTIDARATYHEPHQFPVGIDYVVVGGQVAVDHGTVTSARAGRVLRRV